MGEKNIGCNLLYCSKSDWLVASVPEQKVEWCRQFHGHIYPGASLYSSEYKLHIYIHIHIYVYVYIWNTCIYMKYIFLAVNYLSS
jgi:hypothetical protein